MFNQQMHKVFVNISLFLVTPTRFDTKVSSSRICSYAKVTSQLNVIDYTLYVPDYHT